MDNKPPTLAQMRQAQSAGTPIQIVSKPLTVAEQKISKETGLTNPKQILKYSQDKARYNRDLDAYNKELAKFQPDKAPPEYVAAAYREVVNPVQKKVEELQNALKSAENAYQQAASSEASNKVDVMSELSSYRIPAIRAELQVYLNALQGNKNDLIVRYNTGEIQSLATYSSQKIYDAQARQEQLRNLSYKERIELDLPVLWTPTSYEYQKAVEQKQGDIAYYSQVAKRPELFSQKIIQQGITKGYLQASYQQQQIQQQQKQDLIANAFIPENRGVYDPSTKTYTSPTGEKYSMEYEDAKQLNVKIIPTAKGLSKEFSELYVEAYPQKTKLGDETIQRYVGKKEFKDPLGDFINSSGKAIYEKVDVPFSLIRKVEENLLKTKKYTLEYSAPYQVRGTSYYNPQTKEFYKPKTKQEFVKKPDVLDYILATPLKMIDTPEKAFTTTILFGAGLGFASVYPRLTYGATTIGTGYSAYKTVTAPTTEEKVAYGFSTVLGALYLGKSSIRYIGKKYGDYTALKDVFGTRGGALRSVSREVINEAFALRPKQTGIIPITTKSGKQKLLDIRVGKTREVTESEIQILRQYNTPGKFEVRGTKTYFTPIKATYTRALFVPGEGYQQQRLIYEAPLKQSVSLGKNQFEIISTGDKQYLITGKGLRTSRQQVVEFFQKNKYLIEPREGVITQTQSFVGSGTSTTAKSQKEIVSEILNKNKLTQADKTIRKVPSEETKITEVLLQNKKGEKAIASFFEKPIYVSKGKSDFIFSGIRKTITKEAIPKSASFKGFSAEQRIYQLVKGPKTKVTGGSLGYTNKVDLKEFQGTIEGKKENLLAYIYMGKARGIVSSKSSNPIMLSSNIKDIEIKKFSGGGGSSKGISKGPESKDLGGGGKPTQDFGGSIFSEMFKKQTPYMFEEQQIISSQIGLQSFAPQVINRPSNIFVSSTKVGISLLPGIISTRLVQGIKTKTQQKSLLLLSTNLVQTQTQVQTPILTQVPQTITSLNLIQTPALLSTQVQTPILTQVPVQVQVPVSIPSFSFVGEQPIIPPPSKPIQPWPTFEKSPQKFKKKKQKAYRTYLLKSATKPGERKWQLVASAVPLITALSLGAEATTKDISRRFKIVPEAESVEAKNIVVRTFERLAPMFRSFSQKGGVKVGLPKGEYIQKAKYSLGSREEVKQIQQARRKVNARMF